MLDDQYMKLTQGQKTCLRLVAFGHSSKEIARQTGFTYQTVDQYVSRAVAVLGVSGRREAARLLLQWEEFSKAEFKPAGIAVTRDADIVALSQVDTGWPQSAGTAQANSMHDTGSIPYPAGSGWGEGAERAILPIGGRRNDLTKTQRIYAILKVAFFSMIAMAAIITIASGTLSLFS